MSLLGERGEILLPSLPGRPLRIPYVRNGSGYELLRGGPDGANPSRLTIEPIVETADDDYLAQVVISSAEVQGQTAYYFFLLRMPSGGFRILGDPEAIKGELYEGPADALCVPNGRSNAECEFSSRAAAVAFYQGFVRERLLTDCDPVECEATVLVETP